MIKYGREELNELLEELGQPRDKSLTWEKLRTEAAFDSLLKNYDNYHRAT